MPADTQDLLTEFSDALAARAAAARPITVAIRTARSRPRSGTLWRADAVVASEQVFPRTAEADIVLADGSVVKARTAGRDAGTNVVALRLERPVEAAIPAAAEARLGALVLACGAAPDGGETVRVGIVRSLGGEWHSLAGGRIDRRIALDLTISAIEEGGPVVDAAGGLIGMSTAGPRGRALAIPAATVERVLDPLLTAGRIERGWLGVALHPVALPAAAAAQAAADRGLMVAEIAADGPAAKAGILPGDILVTVGGVAARHPGAIARILGPESLGQTVELRLLRAGALLVLAATVTARPAA